MKKYVEYSKKERGRNILFLGCVYMPTDSENVSVIELKELKEIERGCACMQKKSQKGHSR